MSSKNRTDETLYNQVVLYGCPPMFEPPSLPPEPLPFPFPNIPQPPLMPESAFAPDNFLKVLGRVYDVEQQVIKLELKIKDLTESLSLLTEALYMMPNAVSEAVLNNLMSIPTKKTKRTKKRVKKKTKR